MAEIDSVKNLEKIFNRKSLLDVAIEIENFLDFSNLYVFPNWYKGEIVDGPNVKRYWVTLTLRYPHKDMPDPMGARVLHDVGVKVDYIKSFDLEPIDVKSESDFRPQTKKPKMKKVPVWHVELKIPRRFLDKIDYNDLNDYDDDEVDIETAIDASEEGMSDNSDFGPM